MLNLKRLLELGFLALQYQNTHWYVEKNKFCLFPMNGCWAVGSDFGSLATGVNGDILVIETEDELARYLIESNIKNIL